MHRLLLFFTVCMMTACMANEVMVCLDQANHDETILTRSQGEYSYYLLPF